MVFIFGAANQIRTGDLVLTKDVLYHLSHSSKYSFDQTIILQLVGFVKHYFAYNYAFLKFAFLLFAFCTEKMFLFCSKGKTLRF